MNGEWEFTDGALLVRRVRVGDLDTNCWIVGSTVTRRTIVVDPGDDASRIIEALGDLDVQHIALTHTHWDHVLAVPELADHLGVDVLAHRDDAPVWPDEVDHLTAHGHFDAGTATTDLLECGCTLAPAASAFLWDGQVTPLRHGSRLRLDPDLAAHVLHTPGHTPGGISLYVGAHVFSGDTLFPGGPGLTGWPHSDFSTIICSIRRRLLSLPSDTAIHPGHGASTTVGAEEPHLESWIDRGW
jgi:hydroxyacylglutathione hydrolase